MATFKAAMLAVTITVGILVGIIVLPIVIFVALAVAAIAFFVSLLFMGIKDDINRKNSKED